MAPSEHLAWFEDNINWFENLDHSQLDSDVPNCSGWTVVDVLNHLSFGLGLAYPIALTAPPEADPDHVFDNVRWPTELPVGAEAQQIFVANLRGCARQFRGTESSLPCWTYAGPGTAAFWFRRAAIETTLHRMDVAEALSVNISHLDDEQAADAITETLTFALPFASEVTRSPDGQLVVESACLSTPVSAGVGERKATITGESHDLLNALWGRHRDRVRVTGDHDVANQWLALIETAFANR